jgi:hypothetical protein
VTLAFKVQMRQMAIEITLMPIGQKYTLGGFVLVTGFLG